LVFANVDEIFMGASAGFKINVHTPIHGKAEIPSIAIMLEVL
jgi:hypothetical protein